MSKFVSAIICIGALKVDKRIAITAIGIEILVILYWHSHLALGI